MSYLNAVLRTLFDALLYPFREMPPLVGLLLVSIPVSIGMLLIFKVTSDQDRLAAVKRSIHACLFEIRLFNDDMRAIFRAQLEILRHNMSYLRLTLVPMLWVIIPLVFVLGQLEYYYAYRGLEPGQTALVKVGLKEGEASASSKPAIGLEVPPGIRLETPGVWIPTESEMVWRIAAESPGDYELRVRIGSGTESKSLRVSDEVVRLSPARLEPTFVNQLLYPAEPPLPGGSPLRSIAVTYQGRDVGLFGIEGHWVISFFILTIVFAFALRGWMGVTI